MRLRAAAQAGRHDDALSLLQHRANPSDVDAVVKRAWRKIYDGIGGCIEEAVENSLNKYCTYVAKFPQTEIKTIDAHMVF